MTAFGFGADRFGWTDDALAELRALRGWTEEAIERLELGWDEREHRATFTVTDETAHPVGHLRYLPDPERRNDRRKMLADEGSERQLFPAPETLGDDVRELVLTEGEPDTVAAWSAGFTAVAVPGVGGWQPEYAARFSGRRWTVYVVFDCDKPGRKAAADVVVSLVEQGVDARVIDLDPNRDDKYDLTDYLLEHGAGALRALIGAAEPYADPTLEPIVIEPLRAFLERALPPSESLIGTARDGTNLLPRYGWVMPWGREGSAKTSVLVDLIYHAAAGLAWLHYPTARPLRIVAVINEGIPGGLQDKLAHKLELWDGDRDMVLDNVAIYASPWGEFTFRNARIVDHARAYALDFAADYVALDPLHTLGTTGAGSPQETEEFKNVLRAFGVWADLGVITAHHSNKSGMVSGDWARHPDTVLHLEKDGKNPATKVTLEKARPADPAELGVPMLLEWVPETMGYRRVELDAREKVSDAELLERITTALAGATRPLNMGELQAAVQGDTKRVAVVARNAVESGALVNESASKSAYAFRLARPGDAGETGDTRRGADGGQMRMDTRQTPGDAHETGRTGAQAPPDGAGSGEVPVPPERGHLTVEPDRTEDMF